MLLCFMRRCGWFRMSDLKQHCHSTVCILGVTTMTFWCQSLFYLTFLLTFSRHFCTLDTLIILELLPPPVLHTCFNLKTLHTSRSSPRLHVACDYPHCWTPWYLPKASSHLPSLLSQICHHSKEIHCTFESRKKNSSYTLPAGRSQIH